MLIKKRSDIKSPEITDKETYMSRRPRWSQARERRIGEFSKRKTLLFNGYADQVAHLYRGMDLRR